MSDEIIKVLDDLCKRFGIAIDWTSENVLPYFKQLCEKFISWEITTSFAWIWIWAGVILISLILVIIWSRVANNCGEQWFIFICVVFAAIVFICIQVFDIIECKTFPEKTIFEYIKMNY